MPALDQVLVWVIVGLLGGSLAGLVITQHLMYRNRAR
jgi:hypothetical protein